MGIVICFWNLYFQMSVGVILLSRCFPPVSQSSSDTYYKLIRSRCTTVPNKVHLYGESQCTSYRMLHFKIQLRCGCEIDHSKFQKEQTACECAWRRTNRCFLLNSEPSLNSQLRSFHWVRGTVVAFSLMAVPLPWRYHRQVRGGHFPVNQL